MRPWPATRAALLVRCSQPAESPQSAKYRNRVLKRSFLNPGGVFCGFSPQNMLAALLRPAAQPFLRRTFEEAATPRIRQRAMTRFRKPSGDSPSRTTGNRQPFSNSWQGFQDIHVCDGGTLLECGNRRNKRFYFSCAETVEDESSLWKDKEKSEQIYRGGRGGQEDYEFGKLEVRCRRNKD